MQEEIAQVVSVTEGIVEITTKIQSTCSSCEQNSHCGTGLLARYLAPKPENLTLKTELSLEAGQKIKIGLSETLMLKLAGLIYLMPMILLVIIASLLGFLFPGLAEGWVILSSFCLCAGYFVLLKQLIHSGFISLGEPQILQVFSIDDTPIKLHLP